VAGPWEEIVERLRVEDYYASFGLELRATGSGFKTKCPFHPDDHASFGITKEGRFTCFACGEKGSVFDFQMKKTGQTFREAMEAVAKFAPGVSTGRTAVATRVFDPNIIDAWHHDLLSSPQILAYLAARGIDAESIVDWMLGWTGDRIAIPVWNADGTAASNAKLYKMGGNAGDKMIWAAPGTAASLFVPSFMFKEKTPIVLVEGEFDCIVARQHHINAQSGTAGAGTWKREWSDAFRDHDVYILYDHDEAGVQGATKVAADLSSLGITVFIASWPDETAAGYDVTDWFARDHHSAEELRALLGRARPVQLAATPHPQGVILADLSTVTPRTVDWLWEQRFPLGKLSLIIGDPGLGKSTIALDMAARISTGAVWPDRGYAVKGSVIILSAEDDLEDTVVPRLIQMNADRSRIVALTGVRRGEKAHFFTLADDLPALEEAMERLHPVAVFIDPISSYMGRDVDSHVDADVRSVLGPVAALAAKYQAVVIGIMHLNKSTDVKALYRAGGSIAYVAAARAAFAVAADPDDEERHLFFPVKMNLAPDPPALAYRLNGSIVWEDTPVAMTDIEELLSARPGKGKGQLQAAMAFLEDELPFDVPIPTTEVLKHAGENMVSTATLDRAKRQMPHIRSIRKDNKWFMVKSRASTPPTMKSDVLDSLDTLKQPDKRQEHQEHQEHHSIKGGDDDALDPPENWWSGS
jgi:putative DNA primase/helicase